MLNTKREKKVIWVISDGVPGHFNQSKGVLFALEKLYFLDVHWLEIKLTKRWLRRPLGWMLNRKIPSLNLLPFFYCQIEQPATKPDIVIGAGGNSSFAVTWIARFYQAKSIFCGSLRKLNPNVFDAVLVLEPNLPAPYISLKVSPMALDQPKLKVLAEEWKGNKQYPLYTMLIGGNGAGTQYATSDWNVLAEAMNSIAKRDNIRWLISTSRRTGRIAEQILKEKISSAYIDDAVWWSEQPRSILHHYLAVSSCIFCGADSMSMMMESIVARRKLILYSPEQNHADAKFKNVINRLEKDQLLKLITLENLKVVDGIDQLKTLEYDAVDILAHCLEKRLSF